MPSPSDSLNPAWMERLRNVLRQEMTYCTRGKNASDIELAVHHQLCLAREAGECTYSSDVDLVTKVHVVVVYDDSAGADLYKEIRIEGLIMIETVGASAKFYRVCHEKSFTMSDIAKELRDEYEGTDAQTADRERGSDEGSSVSDRRFNYTV